MAVHKAIRSNSLAQPARRLNPHHLKSELFDTLHQFNRGFATALSALDRLQRPPQPAIFPRDCISNYRNRTQALRALANQDLLRLLAGREEQEAERFGRLCGLPTKPKGKRRSRS